jgi:hypothetical protein
MEYIIKNNKWPQNIPNGHKVYQHVQHQHPSKILPKLGFFVF